MSHTSSSSLLSKIDQALHNSGVGKNDRQSEIVKLLLCRIYASKNNLSVNFSDAKALINFVTNSLRAVSQELPNLTITQLRLDPEALVSVWEILSKLDPAKPEESWVQDIFMKFGPQFLKKDLDQFFTPIEIVEFMCNVLNLGPATTIIDPAGGSADFLTGASHSAKKNAIERKNLQLHYWDQSSEAAEIARLNLWLNDCEAELKIHDSIAETEPLRESIDFCITNPPFGTKTIWAEPRSLSALKDYDLAYRWNVHGKSHAIFRQQLGILFIERGMMLLKPGGVLAIVLPSGYMSNPSERYVRRWLLENHRVLAVVSLPPGTFKKSGAGVSPDIVFIEKTKTSEDYEILMSQAKSIGFDFKKQDVPVIYKRNPIDGSLLFDNYGNPLADNDLIEVANEFGSFAKRHKISSLRHNQDSEVGFVSVKRSDVFSTDDLTLSPKRFSRDYLGVLSRLGSRNSVTLRELGAEVSNSDGFKPEASVDYTYLDIGEVGTGTYRLENQLKGWQLPGRAKQRVIKHDILVSRLAGSVNKFCLIGNEESNLVATNGLFKVKFENEKSRLLFLHFLFTQEYRIQVEALATGSIMEDIKEQDFLDKILVPTDLSDDKLRNLKEFVQLQSKLQSLN